MTATARYGRPMPAVDLMGALALVLDGDSDRPVDYQVRYQWRACSCGGDGCIDCSDHERWGLAPGQVRVRCQDICHGCPACVRGWRVERVPLPRASVRWLGLRLENPAEPGDDGWAEAEAMKGKLYEAANRYLADFAAIGAYQPATIIHGGARCLCGRELAGFLGTFRWGIRYGEGRCSNCGHPARGYHRIVVAADGAAMRLAVLLPYHPSVLEEVPDVDD